MGGMGFPGRFREQFRCYSMVFSTKDSMEVKHGGKIIMPSSALEKLARLNITYPMLFKLSNEKQGLFTHCGVLEFIAEEGRVYVPHWMMNQLDISEGDFVIVDNATLQLATYSKFQPQSIEFLDISNPKAVLESKLRSFACLTKNDVIGIEYNGQIYELKVLDTQPAEAVSIIECDMKVDFAAPVDYVSPVKEETMAPLSPDGPDDIERNNQIKEAVEKTTRFKVFAGEGQRLDGKSKKPQGEPPPNEPLPVGIPNYNYKKGKITFAKASTLRPDPEEPMDESVMGFQAFSGEGQPLRIKKKK